MQSPETKLQRRRGALDGTLDRAVPPDAANGLRFVHLLESNLSGGVLRGRGHRHVDSFYRYWSGRRDFRSYSITCSYRWLQSTSDLKRLIPIEEGTQQMQRKPSWMKLTATDVLSVYSTYRNAGLRVKIRGHRRIVLIALLRPVRRRRKFPQSCRGASSLSSLLAHI